MLSAIFEHKNIICYFKLKIIDENSRENILFENSVIGVA